MTIASPSQPNPIRILVMDDDHQSLALLTAAFSLNSLMPATMNSTLYPVKNEPVVNISDIGSFSVTCCSSSRNAIEVVKQSLIKEDPFAIAFLDIRMEGEQDGIWVGEQLRIMDSDMELVFLTGYSGYDPKEIAVRVPPVHKMIYIQKPFSIHEVVHLAHALGHKWLKDRTDRKQRETLHQLVEEKTHELRMANEALEKKVGERTAHLEEVNTTLKVLLKQREEDRQKIRETILENIQQLVKPMLDKLKMTHLSPRQQNILEALETNLDEITSPFLKALGSTFLRLTPMEIQVAKYVKAGLSNKEMAELMGISRGTVMIHRHNLREKLGITNHKVNLRTHLLSLS